MNVSIVSPTVISYRAAVDGNIFCDHSGQIWLLVRPKPLQKTHFPRGLLMSEKSRLEETKRLMGALVRMKPKPHEELKVGKKKTRKPRGKKDRK